MKDRHVLVLALTLSGLLGLPGALSAQEPEVEVQLASAIVDRMPAEAGSEFPADVGEVFCWTRVSGAEGTTIEHVWIFGDMEFPVSLNVGGSPWRTWSSKSIPPEWSGPWRVEVRDGAGNLLEAVSFNVGT